MLREVVLDIRTRLQKRENIRECLMLTLITQFSVFTTQSMITILNSDLTANLFFELYDCKPCLIYCDYFFLQKLSFYLWGSSLLVAYIYTYIIFANWTSNMSQAEGLALYSATEIVVTILTIYVYIHRFT